MESGLTWLVVALAFSVTLVFMLIIIGKFNVGVQENSFVPNITKNISQDYTDSYEKFDVGYKGFVVWFYYCFGLGYS